MAALASILPLIVYASGFAQFGVRYYVESFPFLIASMNESEASTRRLIVVSVILSMAQTLIVWRWGLA
jgi:hypothetical protein